VNLSATIDSDAKFRNRSIAANGKWQVKKLLSNSDINCKLVVELGKSGLWRYDSLQNHRAAECCETVCRFCIFFSLSSRLWVRRWSHDCG